MKTRLERAHEGIAKAYAELRAAEKEYLETEGIKAKKPSHYGDTLVADMLGDGVIVADRNDVKKDLFDEEYSLRTIYHGPRIKNRRTWWLFYDRTFVALYPEYKILTEFVGSGRTDDLRMPPKEIPPQCVCKAYHHPGTNDGRCAY